LREVNVRNPQSLTTTLFFWDLLVGRLFLAILPGQTYWLGYGQEHNTDIPVIRVERTCVDTSVGEPLLESDEFIESLTHEAELEKHRRNLERADRQGR
jgi:hypothetical protein